jgi:integral membrane sensor domain MASE1
MALPFIVTLAVTFLAWAAAAIVSQGMGDAMTLSASVWLATGVTFGALLVVKPAKRPAVLAGAALAAFALSLLDGLAPLPALAFGANEALAAGLGAWLARLLRAPGPDGRSEPGKAYVGFLLGALLTSALGGVIAIVLWSFALPRPIPMLTEWRVWTCTTFVGILLIAPLLTSFAGFRVKRSGGMATSQFLAGAGTFVLFFVVAALIFSADVSDRFSASLGPTLTYLPLPFMVVTAILWKERGATVATLLGALALIAWTNAGGGPFAEVEGFAGEAVIEVQGYVAVMALLVGVVNVAGRHRRAGTCAGAGLAHPLPPGAGLQPHRGRQLRRQNRRRPVGRRRRRTAAHRCRRPADRAGLHRPRRPARAARAAGRLARPGAGPA